MGNFGQARDELVPKGGDLGGILVDMVAGLLQSRRHAHDGREVFRAGPLAPLLGAALDDVHQRDTLAGVQHAGALGPVELVAGEGEHVDVLRPDINVQVSRRLHGVRVEQDSLFLAHRADLRDGQNRADLVVGVHNGHQGGVGTDGRSHLLRGNGAGGAHRQQLHLKALFFQLLQGVQHGVMLKGGGEDVLLAL